MPSYPMKGGYNLRGKMLKKLCLSLGLVLFFLTAGSVFSAEMIDINTATQQQLETLNGIGPATAEMIIEHREQVGGFKAVNEIMDVTGIGNKKLAKFINKITVSIPEENKNRVNTP